MRKLYSIYYEIEGCNEGEVINFVVNLVVKSEASLMAFIESEGEQVKSLEFVCDVE